MAAVTVSNAMTTTMVDSGLRGNVAAPEGPAYKRALHSPQISVEHADSQLDIGYASKSRRKPLETQVALVDTSEGEPDGSHLMVARRTRVHTKSASLPLSSSLDQFLDRQSPSVDSSAYNSSDFSDDGDLSEASPQSAMRSPRNKKLDSTDMYDLSSAEEMSSDEESTLSAADHLMLPSVDPDDEVFHEFGDIDLCNEADSKLVDWSFNVFIPACKTVLQHCSEGEDTELSSGQILADLRSLSNTINYFCSEQQRLSGQLKTSAHRVSSSISTDRFHKLKDKGPKVLDPVLGNANTASMSSDSASASSSGFESQDSQYDRSYAVKILRSVSQSLIAPLLQDSESGFTPDLYKSIVQAIQKIAWKVEACLSFNDPTKDFCIYSQIFDLKCKEVVSGMMIRAVPPEEPKLQVAVGRASRSNSLSSRKNLSSKEEGTLSAGGSGGGVIRRTPSGRVRPNGAVFDSVASAEENRVVSPEEDVSKSGSTDYDTLFEVSMDSVTTQSEFQLGRRRLATYASPQKVNQVNWRSFDEEESRNNQFTQSTATANRTHYFRPSHHRRTTVSLSRKEVSKLGLNVNKRVDGSMGDREGVAEEPEGASKEGVEAQMKEVKSRLELLTQQFDKEIGIRSRSASTSDLLDDTPSREKMGYCVQHQRPRKGTQVPGEGSMAGKKQGSFENPNLDSNLKRSYTPSMKRQVSDSHAGMGVKDIGNDWTFVDPGSTLDGTRVRTGTKNSKMMVEKGARKVGSKAKKAVEKSLSASGKFTHKLVKTAQALRRGSVSASKRKQMTTSVVSASMDELLEDPTTGPRKNSSRSEPPSPLPKAGTMPSKRASKGTLPRRQRPKSSSSSNSLSRSGRHKSAKSGFLSASNSFVDSNSATALTESIYRLSNSAVQPSHEDAHGEDQLVLSIEYSSRMSKLHRKKSSIISTSSSSMWYEISVMTNMKRLGRSHYTIHRTVKQILALYDIMTNSFSEAAASFPDRPGKKSPSKVQKHQVELFLHHLSQSADLRPSDPFILFLMPDDKFGNFTDNSEISFELLMTFYTPDVYPGPPGSHSEIHVVSPEDVVPSKYTPSPARSRKHSSLQKKGTMHFLKQEGKEDGSTFVIREEGQDALIVSCEEDRYMVVAGTFEKLVEQLACEEKPDPRFVMTFLLGYRHFASTMDLLTLLLSRFHMAVAPDATEEEVSYAEKWRYVIQLRVLDVVTYWLKKCWPDFYRDESVLKKVQEFVTQLKTSQDTNFQLAGTTLEKVLTDQLAQSHQYTTSHSSTTRNDSHSKTSSPASSTPSTPLLHTSSQASPLPPTSADSSTAATTFSLDTKPNRHSTFMGVINISSIQLARQLTLVELEALGTIDTHELVVYTWEANTPRNKPYRRNIDEYIARFNKLSFWVCSEIVSIKDAKTRGLLIEKFIEVAKHCQENKNFNCTISIMSGLSLAAVRRLRKSWEFVNEKWRKSFDKMALIMSPANNHAAYRKLLSTVLRKDPCIPYFGVFMRDLTFFNDGNHKTLKNGLLNFSKLRTMVYKFEELKRYQRSKYFFPPEDKIQECCRNLWCFSESDLYERSLELEPREAPPPSLPEETDV